MTADELDAIEAHIDEAEALGIGSRDGMVVLSRGDAVGLITALRAAWARIAELEAQPPRAGTVLRSVQEDDEAQRAVGRIWCGLCGTYVRDMDHHHIGGQSRGGVT